jgi:hypothetical protein
MSMLTLNGLVHNVFNKPESKDPKTGEVRPASVSAQILADNFLEDGEKRSEMVTLKVPAAAVDIYRKMVGKQVRVPVGAFVAQGEIRYYALKNEPNPTA